MHKFFNLNRYFCLGFIAIALFGAQIVRANDAQFQNNLLRMDVYKTSLGAVKVTLYTTKPYKDSVVVNKKNDQEYVILMPETANLLTSKPSLKSASDVLTNIEVKTQQYGSTQGQKGYTKITISTMKPVEITPHVQTLNVSDYRLSESETKELLEQAAKKRTVTPTKQPVKVVTKAPVAPKLRAQGKTLIAKNYETKKPEKRVEKRVEQRVEKKPAQPSVKKSYQKPSQKLTQKPLAVQQKTVTKQTAIEPPKVVETKPVQKEEVINTVQNPVTTVPAAVTAPPTVETVAPSEVKPQTAGRFGKYQKYVNLLKADKELFAIILIPIIILLLMIRIIRKNRAKKPTGIGLSTKPAAKKAATTPTEDYIDEELDWKEKFKNYKNQPTAPEIEETGGEFPGEEGFQEEFTYTEMPTESDDETQSGLESLFGENVSMTDYTEEAFGETQAEPSSSPSEEESEEPQEDALWDDFAEQEEFQEASIDDLFNDEDNIEESGEFAQEEFSFEQAFKESEAESFQPEEVSQEVLEEDLITKELGLSKKAGFSIDATKGFYLLDFEGTTALIGYIDEEIFVLKRFEEPLQGALQARMSEHTGTSATYIVRVGRFKALIEVTPEKMNLLLEL